MNKGTLYIISAPSGCGKGTLLGRLKDKFEFFLSVSCTTRKPREGEIDGIHYHFMKVADFDKMVSEDAFLEHAGFSEKQYGTPKAPVLENLQSGKDVVLEIEPQGAFIVKEKIPDAVMIFILPPKISDIEHRLRKRSLESGEDEETIQKRLATVVPDIKRSYEYEYVMVNGELDKAVDDLVTIYTKAKNGGEGLDAFRSDSMKKTIDEVLKNA
ncbi:MAG: guanylate kinase [Ruminococcus sp.]|nr:guanylate kinase [Ruminococcus sp.]